LLSPFLRPNTRITIPKRMEKCTKTKNLLRLQRLAAAYPTDHKPVLTESREVFFSCLCMTLAVGKCVSKAI